MFREERSRALCIFLKPRSYLHIKKGKIFGYVTPCAPRAWHLRVPRAKVKQRKEETQRCSRKTMRVLFGSSSLWRSRSRIIIIIIIFAKLESNSAVERNRWRRRREEEEEEARAFGVVFVARADGVGLARR